MSTNNLVIQLNLESRLHKISGAMGLSNLFINASIAIQEQADKIAELEGERFKRDLEMQAEGVAKAISKTRVSLNEGGQRWLCRVDDLSAFSEVLFKQAGEL